MRQNAGIARRMELAQLRENAINDILKRGLHHREQKQGTPSYCPLRLDMSRQVPLRAMHMACPEGCRVAFLSKVVILHNLWEFECCKNCKNRAIMLYSQYRDAWCFNGVPRHSYRPFNSVSD